MLCKNNNREIWREKPGDHYSPSIHVNDAGGIGINVGGYVIVMSVEQWHKLAKENGPQTEWKGTDPLQNLLDSVERDKDGKTRQNTYEEWAKGGGPNECKHGIAAGIPCYECDPNLEREKSKPYEWRCKHEGMTYAQLSQSGHIVPEVFCEHGARFDEVCLKCPRNLPTCKHAWDLSRIHDMRCWGCYQEQRKEVADLKFGTPVYQDENGIWHESLSKEPKTPNPIAYEFPKNLPKCSNNYDKEMAKKMLAQMITKEVPKTTTVWGEVIYEKAHEWDMKAIGSVSFINIIDYCDRIMAKGMASQMVIDEPSEPECKSPTIPKKEPMTQLETLIADAIGQASMCWNPLPTGVFDSSRALRIMQQVVKEITRPSVQPSSQKAEQCDEPTLLLKKEVE